MAQVVTTSNAAAPSLRGGLSFVPRWNSLATTSPSASSPPRPPRAPEAAQRHSQIQGFQAD